jgi:DNA-binding NtrC family response regulator
MAHGRILVVDDEPQFLLAVQSFLENSGFEVIPGTSCRQAEEIYSSAKPDAVVMDYSLGDANAHEILPRLRAVDPSIPIIIMTGHASIELAVQAVKLGAEHFLTKPVDLGTLAVMLERSLDNQQSNRSGVPITNSNAIAVRGPTPGCFINCCVTGRFSTSCSSARDATIALTHVRSPEIN